MNKLSCYIIVFELCDTYHEYPKLIQEIKRYPTWGKLTHMTWAILSPNNATEIRENLRHFIGKEDKLLVIRSGREAAWTQLWATNDWLMNILIK